MGISLALNLTPSTGGVALVPKDLERPDDCASSMAQCTIYQPSALFNRFKDPLRSQTPHMSLNQPDQTIDSSKTSYVPFNTMASTESFDFVTLPSHITPPLTSTSRLDGHKQTSETSLPSLGVRGSSIVAPSTPTQQNHPLSNYKIKVKSKTQPPLPTPPPTPSPSPTNEGSGTENSLSASDESDTSGEVPPSRFLLVSRREVSRPLISAEYMSFRC